MRWYCKSSAHRRRAVSRLSRCLLPVAAALVVQPRIAHSASVTWTGEGDGSSWTDANNWTALPSGTSPGDDLTFGTGAVGTINLLGNERAHSLTFTGGFTLDPPTNSDTLTVSTESISVGSGVTATINAAIAGSGSGLAVSGGGVLAITAANSYGGGTSVNSGTLIAEGADSILNGTINIGTTGTLVLAPTSGVTTLSDTINQNGNLDIPAGVTATLHNNFNQNSGTLSVAGSLVVGDNFNYAGGSVVGTVSMGGMLTIGSGAGGSGTFAMSGPYNSLNGDGYDPVTIPSGMTILATGFLGVGIGMNNGGNLTIVNGVTSSAMLDLSTESTITSTNSGTLTFAGAVSSSNVVDYLTGNLNNTTGDCERQRIDRGAGKLSSAERGDIQHRTRGNADSFRRFQPIRRYVVSCRNIALQWL
jgi:fibronectin-binding autotransporter adhesin